MHDVHCRHLRVTVMASQARRLAGKLLERSAQSAGLGRHTSMAALHCTLCTALHCALQTVHYTLCTALHCTVHCTLCALHCTVHCGAPRTLTVYCTSNSGKQPNSSRPAPTQHIIQVCIWYVDQFHTILLSQHRHNNLLKI